MRKKIKLLLIPIVIATIGGYALLSNGINMIDRVDDDNLVGLFSDYIPEKADKININSATKEELMTLKGIGEKRADAIIKIREETGGFISVEQLKDIESIGDKIYEKIKDKITVE